MVKPNGAPEVIYDPSSCYARKSRPRTSASEQGSYMSLNYTNKQQKPTTRRLADKQDNDNEEMDISKMLKDIQYLGSSTMTWKERKKLEADKVVALGGKPPKQQRLPLSVAKVPMKRKKQREQKKMEEDLVLGRFTRHSKKHKAEKRKPEDRVLRASEGHFSKGVLNVKHLLERPQSRSNYGPHNMGSKAKKKGQGKGKGKGKGEGKKGKRR